MNYTYLLECADHTLYCGWTNHLEKRVRAHNEGRGAKYTKSRRPVTLVYYEEFGTKTEAMKREAAIKRLSRSEKQRLIKGGPDIETKTCNIHKPHSGSGPDDDHDRLRKAGLA